jgi:transcriptional regulator with XRE-family HTH domain
VTRRINVRLKAVLIERGITQRQLAYDLRYDPSYVSRVILGWEPPPREFMTDVARYLKCPAAELFSPADIDRATR